MSDIKTQIQEVQRTPGRINTKIPTGTHIFKPQNIKEKGGKKLREQTAHLQNRKSKNSSVSPQKPSKPRKSKAWDTIFKVLGGSEGSVP